MEVSSQQRLSTAAKQIIDIVHLYPESMNIYGDTGNIMALSWRLESHGYRPVVTPVRVGDKLPAKIDILIAGGGQDSGQKVVQDDLQRRAQDLKRLSKDGAVMLVVCGTYQLFGHYFEIDDRTTIPGIGIFDMFTKAGDERLIGNIVVQSPFGRLVGFENHSGQTYLEQEQLPLGAATKGYGNNDFSHKEGAVTDNTFGTYLHGPILPKNPHFIDELIRRAASRRYGRFDLVLLNDTVANKAADIAAKRP